MLQGSPKKGHHRWGGGGGDRSKDREENNELGSTIFRNEWRETRKSAWVEGVIGLCSQGGRKSGLEVIRKGRRESRVFGGAGSCHFSGATGEKGPSGNSQVSVGTRRQREFSEKNGEGSRRFTGGKSGRLSQVGDSQGCLDMRVWMLINDLEALLK